MPRIQDHLPKLSWIAADKLLFVLYGGIALVQIRAMPPVEYGLYALFVSIQTWIFVVADGMVLQGLIQFGADRAKRPWLDGTAAVTYAVIVAGLVVMVIASEPFLGHLFEEPRFSDVAWLELVFCAVTIPRTFCLRVLMRDIQTRQLFLMNAAWLGSMALATLHGVVAGWLHSFESLATIAIAGMATSSLVGVYLARSALKLMRIRTGMVGPLVQFGLRQMSTSVIHTSVRQLDVVIAQTFFGTATVGVYQAAKTLFRLFELGLDAATSIVYPAAVQYHASGNRTALSDVTTKAMSALLVAFTVAVVIVWSAGHLIGFILGSRYDAAIATLETMSIASLLMPLTMAGIVLVARGAVALHARITAIAAIAAMTCFVTSGIIGVWWIFPGGIIAYYTVLGIGDWVALKRLGVYHLRLADLWRIIPDAWSYTRQR